MEKRTGEKRPARESPPKEAENPIRPKKQLTGGASSSRTVPTIDNAVRSSSNTGGSNRQAEPSPAVRNTPTDNGFWIPAEPSAKRFTNAPESYYFEPLEGASQAAFASTSPPMWNADTSDGPVASLPGGGHTDASEAVVSSNSTLEPATIAADTTIAESDASAVSLQTEPTESDLLDPQFYYRVAFRTESENTAILEKYLAERPPRSGFRCPIGCGFIGYQKRGIENHIRAVQQCAPRDPKNKYRCYLCQAYHGDFDSMVKHLRDNSNAEHKAFYRNIWIVAHTKDNWNDGELFAFTDRWPEYKVTAEVETQD
ncbi:hypothetical protein BJ508DRAFT_367326 [Ascobolus immersus RN42]|uniref:Uncharacterized protein n=1 Tax=Ascobolus immersus RN42 TaxID=1160509 RepID=A0A3N4HDD2_ASCIM|nr:hypothetical protein BJ508DRAFT_367326 [Ascobolus immersus RN42]